MSQFPKFPKKCIKIWQILSSASRIDIILGVDVFEQLVGSKKIAVSDQLYARDTPFGFVLSGLTPFSNQTRVASFHIAADFDLKQFWELEELPKRISLSDEEQLCEDHFRQTTIVREKRFSVKLPFKDVQLGDSLCQAETIPLSGKENTRKSRAQTTIQGVY